MDRFHGLNFKRLSTFSNHLLPKYGAKNEIQDIFEAADNQPNFRRINARAGLEFIRPKLVAHELSMDFYRRQNGTCWIECYER